MQQSLPCAAIIICNFNYGKWLPDAVRSAALQDYPSKVIVVVDDASTDGSINAILGDTIPPAKFSDETKDIYEASMGGVPLFFIQLKQNGGPSRARNIAMELVQDKVIGFLILDADDILYPTKLSKCMARFLEDPERIGAICADYLHLGEDGITQYESKEPYSYERLWQECIVHSGSFLSKLAISRVGPYWQELRTCEDYNLFLRISNNFLFVHIPESLTIVRVHPENSTNTVSKENWQRNYQMAFLQAQGRI